MIRPPHCFPPPSKIRLGSHERSHGDEAVRSSALLSPRVVILQVNGFVEHGDLEDDACRYAGMSKNQSWICAFVFWINALLSVGFFFFLFCFYLNWKFVVDSVSLVLPDVWRMSCFSLFSWALLLRAAFVFPFPFGRFGWPAHFRGAERGHRRRVSCRKPLAGNGCFIVARMFESCLRSGGNFTAWFHS